MRKQCRKARLKRTKSSPGLLSHRQHVNFNKSQVSLAAVEEDLFSAEKVQQARAKRLELMWDGSLEAAKEFPQPERKTMKNISTVYVRSNLTTAVSGGKVHNFKLRLMDTAHLIKRKQTNGLTPVVLVNEDLVERRQIARRRLKNIVHTLILPIESAYRHYLRIVSCS